MPFRTPCHRHIGLLLALTALPGIAACGDDDANPVYLGAIDASTPSADATAPPVDAGITLPQWTSTECAGPTYPGAVGSTPVASLSAVEGRALVVTETSVEAYKLGTDGCLDERITSFGANGTLELAAVGAVPIAAGRSLVATSAEVLVIGSAGDTLGKCQAQGADVQVRSLSARADGTVLGAFLRSPVWQFTVALDNAAACSVSSVALTDDPFSLLAIGVSAAGFYGAEQAEASQNPQLTHYEVAAGEATAASVSKNVLCSATSVAEAGNYVAVADAACKRVVVFESGTLKPIAEAPLAGSPRSLAPIPGGTGVIVAAVRPTENGTEAYFSVVSWP